MRSRAEAETQQQVIDFTEQHGLAAQGITRRTVLLGPQPKPSELFAATLVVETSRTNVELEAADITKVLCCCAVPIRHAQCPRYAVAV
jgi:peptidoglycan hydrolase-like protein with peptidoglycan-binding domain